MSDDELVKMLSGMGMGEGMSEEGIMPMMQQMMKQLLSKDILYPSLKDISSKVGKHSPLCIAVLTGYILIVGLKN